MTRPAKVAGVTNPTSSSNAFTVPDLVVDEELGREQRLAIGK